MNCEEMQRTNVENVCNLLQCTFPRCVLLRISNVVNFSATLRFNGVCQQRQWLFSSAFSADEITHSYYRWTGRCPDADRTAAHSPSRDKGCTVCKYGWEIWIKWSVSPWNKFVPKCSEAVYRVLDIRKKETAVVELDDTKCEIMR